MSRLRIIHNRVRFYYPPIKINLKKGDMNTGNGIEIKRTAKQYDCKPSSRFVHHVELFLFAVLLCALPFSSMAQSKLGSIVGRIYTASGPLEFASVALFVENQPKPIDGTLSDKKGNYRIQDLAFGRYRMEISYLGYEKKSIKLTIDSLRPAIHQDIELQVQSIGLNEVRVSAGRREQIGKEAYKFSKQQIAQARYAQELLFTLPQIKPDIRSGNISSATNESAPLILLNGIVSSNEELKMIPPHKVIRVDYYDLPPLRYHTTSAVIDVITKPLDDGESGGTDLGTAPLASDFIGRGFYSYNRGRHRANLFAYAFFRDTQKGNGTKESVAYVADKSYQAEYERKDHFNSQGYKLKAAYTFSGEEEQVFQAAISGTYDTYSNRQKADAHEFAGANIRQLLSETQSSDCGFSPVVDLYYDRRLGQGARLYSNLVLTSNFVQATMASHEAELFSPSVLLHNDYLKADNRKHSAIAQVEYARSYPHLYFRIGTKAQYSQALFDISGRSLDRGSKDEQRQYRQRIYASFEGKLSELAYRLVPAFSLAYASAHEGQEKEQYRLFFSPSAQLLYRSPKGHRLRFELEASNNIPDLGNTTMVLRQMREGWYYRNNPRLRNSYTTNATLYYNFDRELYSINSRLYFRHSKDDFITTFVREEINRRIALVQQRDNARFAQEAGSKIALAFNPLRNDNLSLQFHVAPNYKSYQLYDGQSYELWSIRSGISANYRYKAWFAAVECTAPYQKLLSHMVDKNSWYSGLAIGYQWKNWSFRTSLENLFSEEKSRQHTHPSVLLQNESNVVMKDNLWKFGINISYTFETGKKYKARIQLENEDSDSGRI